MHYPVWLATAVSGGVDIASVDCAPGQKKARESFAPDRGFVDFGQLFAATSMMPSHVIADELGIDVTTAINNNDGAFADTLLDDTDALDTGDVGDGRLPEVRRAGGAQQIQGYDGHGRHAHEGVPRLDHRIGMVTDLRGLSRRVDDDRAHQVAMSG